MALLGTVRNKIGEDRRKEENRAEVEERKGAERRGENENKSQRSVRARYQRKVGRKHMR
jgi:hypothetical protein